MSSQTVLDHFERVQNPNTTAEQQKESFDLLVQQSKTLDDALFYVGRCYEKNLGVPTNHSKAIECYEKCITSDQINYFLKAHAHNNIGSFYLLGFGCEKDSRKAVLYYEKSVEMNNSMAYRNLGNCYLNGWGVVKDEEKAFEWFRKAFALGSKQAVSDLVKCYRNGIGTKESFFQSIILKKQYVDHYQFESKGDLCSSDYEEEVWELLQEKKKALHFILKKELKTFLLKELSCIVCSYFE